MSQVAVLELHDVTKDFAGQRAVDSVSLALAPGEFFCLVGPSGCGKTTTLRLVAGFETPTQGEIRLEGRNITHLPPFVRDVTTVFQSYALFPHLSVSDNVRFGLQRHRVARAEAEKRAEEALAMVHLDSKRSRRPDQLSGGERQRVALARALVVRPKVLLLDEPLSAMDPHLRKEMRQELKNVQRQVGITFLFITHDQQEALSMPDRLGVMNGGRLLQVGTPAELYRKPQSRFVAEFLGEVSWFGDKAVRPESIAVSRSGPGQRATVENVAYFGSRVQMRCRVGDSLCLADAPSEIARTGEEIFLSWNEADELPVTRTVS